MSAASSVNFAETEQECIGYTERGSLWYIGIGQHPNSLGRLIRRIDAHYVDASFRQDLSSLRQKPAQNTLPIIADGWAQNEYYVEYQLDSPWTTLEKHQATLNWRQRLQVILQLCELLPKWERGPSHAVGLNGFNVIMKERDGQYSPWLLPCPALKHDSPHELIQCDFSILACLAPELLRGIYSDARVQDGFALGVLAGLALGCKLSERQNSDSDVLEDQVCGKLFRPDLNVSEVDPFLQSMDEFRQLGHNVRQSTLTQLSARHPQSVDILRQAVFAALNVTSSHGLQKLAQNFAQDGEFKKAMQVLNWEFKTIGENVTGHELTSEISEAMGDFQSAVQHINRALELSPGSVNLRRRRVALNLGRYLTASPISLGSPDLEGDLILADLKWLAGTPLDSTEAKNLLIQQAMIYIHRQDHYGAAEVLYLVVDLDPADLDALYLYARSLLALGDYAGVNQIISTAGNRIENLVRTGILIERKAVEWREKFAGLLSAQ